MSELARNRKVPTVITSPNQFTSQLISNNFFVDFSEDLYYLFDDVRHVDVDFPYQDRLFFHKGLLGASVLMSIPAFLQRTNVLVIPEFTEPENKYKSYTIEGQTFNHMTETFVAILPTILAKKINYHVKYTICVPTNYRNLMVQRMIDYYEIPTVEMSRQYRLGDENITFTLDDNDYDAIQLTNIHNYSNGVFNASDLKNDFVSFTNGDFNLIDLYLGDKPRIVGDEINDKYKLLSNLKTVVESESPTRKSQVYKKFDEIHNNLMRIY